MRRNTVHIIFFFVIFCKSFAQNATIDSLRLVLGKEKNDSVRSLILVDLASNYLGYDTSKCDEALQQAVLILKNNQWDYNWGHYYDATSQEMYFRGKSALSLMLADSALFFYNRAAKQLNEHTKRNAEYKIASVTEEKGATYNAMGKNDESIRHYLVALQLFDKSNLPEKTAAIANCYNDIATLYFRMEQYDKSLEYDLKSIPYHVQTGDNEAIAFSYIYTASDFIKTKKFNSAETYFQKAKPYVEKLNKPSVNVEYYGHRGNLFSMEQNWTNAIENYSVAYNNAKEVDQFFNEVVFSMGISNSWFNLGNLSQAEKFALYSSNLADANNFIAEKARSYKLLSLIYSKGKSWQKAYAYLDKYETLNDSIKADELKQKVNELDTKYQAEKNEQEISRLEEDKQIQSLTIKHELTTNYILIGSLAALMILGFLGYRNFRTRQQLAKQQHELQQQRIRELEKDRQLMAVDAMLKGQEEERSRLAKDLHDGLGGLLSGVKFSLSSMKGNVMLSEENVHLFNSAIEQLDNAMNEMRRVAHNMMPETLMRFGLVQALTDFCENINETKNLRINLQTFGLDERMDASTEIIVYRIVQELLNNVLKHANAKTVLLQLIKHHDQLSMTVEDDGRGFDTSILVNGKGAGMHNIHSRVDYLKGSLDIQSQPGKGTSIHITCTLNDE